MTAQVVSLFEVLPAESQQFITFWYRYPRKQGKSDAMRAWAKLSQAQRAAAIAAIRPHVAHWALSGTERRYIPHAATWLNGHRWEDELQDLDQPLTDLGQCHWNANGTREPGPRCSDKAKKTNPANGYCYCERHAAKLGLGRK